MAIDIKEEYQIYRGNTVGADVAVQDEAELARIQFARDRFMYMSNAKSVVENKFQLAKQLYEVYEHHLQQGEVWNAPYRFPELFGCIQRKASDLINNLPEAKVHSTKSASADFAIALQGTLDHTERMTNALREKVRVIYDTLMYGTGILYEAYAILQKEVTPIDETDTGEIDLFLEQNKKKLITYYSGVCSERVDPRDFFIDDQASIFYDETGIMGARDCFRRRYYPYSTFMERFKGFKNINSVIPVAWGTDFFGKGKNPYPKESQEQKMVNRYVVVYEYWNQELDYVQIIANQQEIYYGAIPFKHKRLPFICYYNYRRDDSVWGISETEIVAPFIYAKEELINLQILDAKLGLQAPLAVSGDVTFNAEENELQPGAIFTLRGLNGGKVQDAIMPLRFGEIPESSFKVQEKIEDNQIAITGDDVKALYENPDQLATQTLAKKQTSQKRDRANIMQNTIESERSRVQIRLSNIIQYYAKPFQNINGDVEYRRIKVDGYRVKQDNDETKPEFTQSYGLVSYFSLNPASTGSGDGIEIEVIDAVMEDNIKQEEIQDMMTLVEKLTELLPLDQTLAQSVNVIGLIKQIAKKLDVDYDEIFPTPVGQEGEDSIDLELQLVLMGVTPDVDPNMDPMKALMRYNKFQKTPAYKKSSKEAQKALQTLITSTLANAKTYYTTQLAIMRQFDTAGVRGLPNMAPTGQTPGQGGGPSNGQISPTTLSNGSAANIDQSSTAVSAPRGVSARLGFGAPQPTQINPRLNTPPAQ